VPAGVSRSDGGCGQPAGALALLGLVPLVLRRRGPRPLRAERLSRRS
jgi:Synergist-CTERM protein sorting domain-containing protein